MPFFIYAGFNNLYAENKSTAMRKIILTIFIIIFGLGGTSLYSQRCGDGVWLSFKKTANKFLDSTDIKITLKTFDRRFKYYNAPGHTEMLIDTLSDTAAYITYVDEMNAKISVVDSNKLYFPTGCGFFRMEFTITDQVRGDTMKLIMYKVPHDMPMKLNDIVISAGVYEFNINGILDLATFKEDKNGVYNFDFSNFKVQ